MSSSGSLFTLTNFEIGVLKAKNWMNIFDEFGKDSAFKVVNIFDTMFRSISEEILFR